MLRLQQMSQLIKILQYSFSLQVLHIQLQSALSKEAKVCFKIGPKEVFTTIPIKLNSVGLEPVSQQMLELSSEILYNQNKRHYQHLKAMVKIFLVTDKGDRLAGTVSIELDRLMNSYSWLGAAIEQKIQNCLDPEAKLKFMLRLRDNAEENRPSDISMQYADPHELPSIDNESSKDEIQHITEKIHTDIVIKYIREIESLKLNEQTLKSDKDKYQATIIELRDNEEKLKKQIISIKKEQLNIQQLLEQREATIAKFNQKSSSNHRKEHQQAMSELTSQNRHLKSMIILHEEAQRKLEKKNQQLNKEIEILDRTNVQSLKKKVKQLQRSLKDKSKESPKKEQNLARSFSQSNSPNKKSGCQRCLILEEQFLLKEQDYDSEIDAVQKLLTQYKHECKRLQLKLQSKVLKCRFLETQYQKLAQFRELLAYIYEGLVELKRILGFKNLSMSSTKEQTEPSTFRMIFDELMYEIKGSVCHSPKVKTTESKISQDQVKKNISSLQQQIKQKQAIISKVESELLKSHNRIEQLEQTVDALNKEVEMQHTMYRKLSDQKGQERLSNQQNHTAKFNELSYGRLPLPDSEDRNYIINLQEIINRLKQEKQQLQQQLRRYKDPLMALKKDSMVVTDPHNAINQEIRKIDDEFELDPSGDLEKMISVRDQIYQQLQSNHTELVKKSQKIKKQNEMLRQQITELRNELESRKSTPKKNNLPIELHIIEEENVQEEETKNPVEDDIKDWLDSLGGNVESAIEPTSDLAKFRKAFNDTWFSYRADILNKLDDIDTEVVMMHSRRLNYCRSSKETQQTLVDLNKVKNKFMEMKEFVERVVF